MINTKDVKLNDLYQAVELCKYRLANELPSAISLFIGECDPHMLYRDKVKEQTVNLRSDSLLTANDAMNQLMHAIKSKQKHGYTIVFRLLPEITCYMNVGYTAWCNFLVCKDQYTKDFHGVPFGIRIDEKFKSYIKGQNPWATAVRNILREDHNRRLKNNRKLPTRRKRS